VENGVVSDRDLTIFTDSHWPSDTPLKLYQGLSKPQRSRVPELSSDSRHIRMIRNCAIGIRQQTLRREDAVTSVLGRIGPGNGEAGILVCARIGRLESYEWPK
jgi:hypothetical protein